MKRRYRLLLNVCSFALLAFALYLNFVKNEVPELPTALSGGTAAQPVNAKAQKAASKPAGHSVALK